MFSIFQFFTTLLMIVFIKGTILKAISLLIFWALTFGKKLTTRELLFFITMSFIFTLANFGALDNQTFVFRDQDLFLMPYHEIFMWGFYCLLAYHRLGPADLKIKNKPFIAGLVLAFSVSFSVIHQEIALAIVGSLILLSALLLLRGSNKVLRYVGVFGAMGAFVESYGIYFNFWHYPHAVYFSLPIWSPFMWLNIGWIIAVITHIVFKSEVTN